MAGHSSRCRAVRHGGTRHRNRAPAGGVLIPMKTSVLLLSMTVGVGLAAWALHGRGATSAPGATPARRPGMPVYSSSGYDITPLPPARIAAIVKTLTPEQA